jgi:hypothetical protein
MAENDKEPKNFRGTGDHKPKRNLPEVLQIISRGIELRIQILGQVGVADDREIDELDTRLDTLEDIAKEMGLEED